MPNGSTLATFVLLGLAAAVTLYLVFRGNVLVRDRAGKMTLMFGVFLLPAGAVVVASSHAVHESSRTEFCLSCHEMKPFGQTLHIDDTGVIPAIHFQNHMVSPDEACFTCHTNYGLFGDTRAKVNGLRHVWVHFLGTIPKKIRLYDPFPNDNCLHCHRGMRLFTEQEAHHSCDPSYEAILDGKASCVSGGCHDTIHPVNDLKDYKFWPKSLNEKKPAVAVAAPAAAPKAPAGSTSKDAAPTTKPTAAPAPAAQKEATP